MDENWFKNKSLWSRWKNAYLKDANFRKFWRNFNKKNLDKDLVKLVDYYISSESYKFSSRFWNIINIRHINQINEFGEAYEFSKKYLESGKALMHLKKIQTF